MAKVSLSQNCKRSCRRIRMGESRSIETHLRTHSHLNRLLRICIGLEIFLLTDSENCHLALVQANSMSSGIKFFSKLPSWWHTYLFILMYIVIPHVLFSQQDELLLKTKTVSRRYVHTYVCPLLWIPLVTVCFVVVYLDSYTEQCE